MDWYPPGMPDELFIRGDVPMTKAEVRAVSIAKARLRPHMRVMDIGAGTGSFTIEAALLCPDGELLAVEYDPDALELLRRNIAHFGVRNVTVIEGKAPDVLAGMPPCDRIFIGGTGGNMAEILDALPGYLQSGGRVVANTICLESTASLVACFRQPPWTDWEIVQVSVARGLATGPKLVRFEALNPVWVTSAELSRLRFSR